MNCVHDEIPDNAILHFITLTSKILSTMEWYYSNIKHETLGILDGLEKPHHYCFVRAVCMINDHKPLVPILSKDEATLSQWLQCIRT